MLRYILPFLTLFATTTLAQVVNHIVVFGDSYSDTGNNQRLSNGPLWSEHLAVGWNATQANFAYSGSVCNNDLYSDQPDSETYIPSIVDQVEMFYKQNMSLNMQEVAFAFWVGVNDIYKILEQHQDPAIISQEFKKVVDCIGTQVRQVRQVFSAHKFIVFNMPPMEQMPFYANTEFANTREKATNEFNEFLRKDIEKMNKHLQAIELDLVDVHRLIQDMVEKSDLFEIKNVKDPYWDVCQGQCDDAIDSYVWWDKTHLTGGVHRLIANSILMSGSLAEETSLSNDVDVNALLNEPNSHYRSAIYKAKKNTGAMAKQIEKLKKEDTSTSAENDLEVDQDDSHAGFMYLFILCAVLACAGFFLYKKRKGSHLAALSGLIKNNNNSDRGRFMPLRNMDSEV